MAIVGENQYGTRLAEELKCFESRLEVHDLPNIFHYWSVGTVRPKLEAFGFSSPQGMFKKYLEELCRQEPNRTRHFISIGSGNCDLEITLAQHLLSQGYSHFVIDCLDMNPAMLERGLLAAGEAGVATQIQCVQGDFNRWEPAQGYHGVIACHSLHHVTNLEGLFRQIRRALEPQGLFLISDIVGRNGHQRWPEALQIVQEFWQELPQSYRFNQLLQRHEESYVNWDCSVEGFEGIRSQDILPLLLKNFYFRVFVAYGNVIDPFVDRPFGHNFDATAEWDRNFIDRVRQRDQEEMLAGRIKPVHIEAVVAKEAGEPMLFHPPFTPGFCVRWPDPEPEVLAEQDLDPLRLVAEKQALQEELTEVKTQMSRAAERLEAEKQALQEKLTEVKTQMSMAADSRWLKLGRQFGLGPKLR